MATIAATENRRANRQARRQIEDRRREQREQRERLVAVRMRTRFYKGHPVGLLAMDYRYWQLRRCGWDLLSADYARNARGEPCDPQDSHLWWFWTRLHYRDREKLVLLSRFRLVRG